MRALIIEQLFEVIDGALLSVLFRIEMLHQPAFIGGVVLGVLAELRCARCSSTRGPAYCGSSSCTKYQKEVHCNREGTALRLSPSGVRVRCECLSRSLVDRRARKIRNLRVGPFKSFRIELLSHTGRVEPSPGWSAVQQRNRSAEIDAGAVPIVEWFFPLRISITLLYNVMRITKTMRVQLSTYSEHECSQLLAISFNSSCAGLLCTTKGE